MSPFARYIWIFSSSSATLCLPSSVRCQFCLVKSKSGETWVATLDLILGGMCRLRVIRTRLAWKFLITAVTDRMFERPKTFAMICLENRTFSRVLLEAVSIIMFSVGMPSARALSAIASASVMPAGTISPPLNKSFGTSFCLYNSTAYYVSPSQACVVPKTSAMSPFMSMSSMKMYSVTCGIFESSSFISFCTIAPFRSQLGHLVIELWYEKGQRFVSDRAFRN